jgi:hypothetical protein
VVVLAVLADDCELLLLALLLLLLLSLLEDVVALAEEELVEPLVADLLAEDEADALLVTLPVVDTVEADATAVPVAP